MEPEVTPNPLNDFVNSEAARTVKTAVEALIANASTYAEWQHLHAVETGLRHLGVLPLPPETPEE